MWQIQENSEFYISGNECKVKYQTESYFVVQQQPAIPNKQFFTQLSSFNT